MLDLDSDRASGKAGPPQIQRRMDGARQGLVAKLKTCISRADAEGFCEPALIAGTGSAGTDA